MRRIEAIVYIMDSVTDEIVVSSCGMISRELFHIRDRPKNFYVQGSMGAALPIGIGLALSTGKKVMVIAGDGEILMSLSTLVLLEKLRREKKLKLDLFILDNNSYQTTGGQKTVSKCVVFGNITDCTVVRCSGEGSSVPRINIPHSEITKRFMEAIF